jgi:hypothetical protein
MLDEVDSAVRLAARAYSERDPLTGRALLAAARSTLGSIDQRFQMPGLGNVRLQLSDADAELRRLQESGKDGAWDRWRRSWPARKLALRAAEPRSLFNPVVLRRQL